MVAGVQQRRDGEMHRSHAARRADRADASFQRRKALLEHCRGRVRNPCIDVACAFEIEQRRGVLGILKNVGCGLIDRDCPRAGDGIRMLACMQTKRFESGRLGCGHVELENDFGFGRHARCATKALRLLAQGFAGAIEGSLFSARSLTLAGDETAMERRFLPSGFALANSTLS